MKQFTYTTQYILVSLVVVAITTFCKPCHCRKDRNLPHPHKGQLAPYVAGPFQSLILDKHDEQELELGHPVMKQNRGSELAGGAICIQDVDAPKEAVWAQILDLDSYKGKVPKVNECKNYIVKQNDVDGTCTMKTKMVVGVIPGYAVCCCCCVDWCSVVFICCCFWWMCSCLLGEDQVFRLSCGLLSLCVLPRRLL